MASKRRLRKKSCGNKIKYESEEQAIRAIIGIYRNREFSGKVVPYICQFCRKWHIGHKIGYLKEAHQKIYLRHQYDFI
jgi:hypothetical protein